MNLQKDHHRSSYKKKYKNYLAAYSVNLYETMEVEAWPSLHGWMFHALSGPPFAFVFLSPARIVFVLTLLECQKSKDNF